MTTRLDVIQFLIFLLLSALVLVRGLRSGWFFVLTGVAAAATGAYWTLTLTEFEVVQVLLGHAAGLFRWVATSALYLWTGLPVQPIIDWIAQLEAWGRQLRGTLTSPGFAVYLPAAFLLAIYIAAKWAANAAWRVLLLTLQVSGLRRAGNRAEIVAANARVVETAGVRLLMIPLVLAIAFLGYSFAMGHGMRLNRSDVTRILVELHQPLFWLGAYILLLELMGQIVSLEAAAKERSKNLKAAETTGCKPRESLAVLYDALLEKHGEHLLYWQRGHVRETAAKNEAQEPVKGGVGERATAATSSSRGVIPAPSFVDGDDPSALQRISTLLAQHALPTDGQRAIIKDLRAFLAREKDFLVESPLHPLHLDILFLLCEHHQAEGQLSLIICPDDRVDYVAHQLDRLRARSFAGLVQRAGQIDKIGEMRLDSTYSYILAGESDIATLLDTAARQARHVLHNLGFICCLDLQHLNVALLRMQLSRLWLRLDRASIRILVQSNGAEKSLALARILFPQIETTGAEGKRDRRPLDATSTLTFDDIGYKYVLVWPDDASAAKMAWGEVAASTAETRLSLPLALAALAGKASEPARFAMQDGGPDRLEVQQAANALSGQPALAATMRDTGAGTFDHVAGTRVVIADVGGSTLPIIAECHDRQLDPDGEVLVSVTAPRYPLRDYHIARLRHAGAMGAIRSGTQVATQSYGGFDELLTTLRDVLREPPDPDAATPRGLPRRVVFEHFVRQLPEELADDLTPTPGRSRLEQLFEAKGMRLRISMTRDHEDTRYFAEGPAAHADGDAGASSSDGAELATTCPVLNAQGDEIGRIPASEWWLGVLPGSRLLINGEGHHVEELFDRSGRLPRHVRATPDRRDAIRAAEVVRPVLEYRLLGQRAFGEPTSRTRTTLSSDAWITRKAMTADNDVELFRHFGFFERRVLGTIRHPADEAPLARPTNLAAGIRQATVQRRYRPVLQVRLTKLDGRLGGERGGDPLGGHDARARLAYTLAIVMQDVVRALFPRWPHRLAVIAPQAAALQREAGQLEHLTRLNQGKRDRAHADQLLAYLYPRWSEAHPDQEAGGRGDTATEMHEGEEVAARTPEEAEAARRAAEAATPLDLFLLEDSDVDLGVVRALTGDPSRLWSEMHSFLTWASSKDKCAGRSDYHRMGATENPTHPDFQLALDCLVAYGLGGSEINAAAPPHWRDHDRRW